MPIPPYLIERIERNWFYVSKPRVMSDTRLRYTVVHRRLKLCTFVYFDPRSDRIIVDCRESRPKLYECLRKIIEMRPLDHEVVPFELVKERMATAKWVS